MPDEAAVSAIYQTIGEETLTQVVASFYRRVPTDEILGPMYPPEDLAGAERRLLGFLRFRFGGPQDYIMERGHPRLRMRHAPFVVDAAARDRWFELMSAAVREANVPEPAATTMLDFLADIATFLINAQGG